MRLTFLHGGAAAGKLTVARLLAQETGDALFHNHLVVDAVGAVFAFGTAEFVALRERWWLDMIGAAALAGRSTIFTFMPESSVAPDFPARVHALIETTGGMVRFVRLDVDPLEQERRIVAPDRAAFGKLGSVAMLRALRSGWAAAAVAMPAPDLVIDTGRTGPREAARRIAALA